MMKHNDTLTFKGFFYELMPELLPAMHAEEILDLHVADFVSLS